MDIEFEIETRIARPVEDVFAVVSDPSRLPEWDPRVVEAEVLGGGPLAEGKRVREVRRLGRRRVEQVVAVQVLEPPRRLDLRIVDGPVPVHADMRFDAAGDGASVLRLRAHGRAPGPRLLAPLARAMARRQMRAHHRRIKALIEA